MMSGCEIPLAMVSRALAMASNEWRVGQSGLRTAFLLTYYLLVVYTYYSENNITIIVS